MLQTMLDARAKEDALFAEAMARAGKSVDECWNYVMGEARKMATGGCACVADDEVMNWAVHYYVEDNIEVESANVADKVRSVAVERGLKEHEVNPVDVEHQNLPVQKKVQKKVVDESLFVGSLF